MTQNTKHQVIAHSLLDTCRKIEQTDEPQTKGTAHYASQMNQLEATLYTVD